MQNKKGGNRKKRFLIRSDCTDNAFSGNLVELQVSFDFPHFSSPGDTFFSSSSEITFLAREIGEYSGISLISFSISR